MTLKIAWRSFRRHVWRSAITSAAVAFGLALLLVFIGIADDMHARMAELGIRMGSGNVLVEAAGYRDTQTLDHVVHDADRIAAQVRRVPGVEQVAVRLRASGLLSAGEHSAPVLVSGVEPRLEASASDITRPRARVAGEYLRPEDQMPFSGVPPDIYLGKTLAELLVVGVGDRVVLTLSPPGNAEPTSGAFLVRGIFRTGVDDLDGAYAEIPIQAAQTLVRLPGAATEVAALSTLSHTEAIATRLRDLFASDAELSVVPWRIALRELHDALVLDDAGLYAMMLIVFIVVAIGIFNTVLMSVTEGTREFGVMMALGTSAKKLGLIIVTETCLLALVSLAAGVTIALLLDAWIGAHGIDLTPWTGEVQFAGIAWSGRVYSELGPATVVRWSVVVFLVVLASSVYPALRVMRLQPVEAMHHV